MSYPFSSVFKALLPKGDIYQLESFTSFVEKLSKEFDRARDYTDATFSQVPGQITDEKIIDAWEEFLGLSADKLSNNDRQKRIKARLSEYGGGSLSYLKTIADRASDRDIEVKNSKLPMIFEVIGIKLSPTKRITSRSAIRRPIRTFSREEEVISAVERVKHAHIDSRYYDRERTVYA